MQPDPTDYENPEAITITEITDFSTELAAVAGAARVPLGTPTHGTDKRYLMARFGNGSVTSGGSTSATLPWGFGHNMVYDNNGTLTPEDDFYGAVVLGLKVTGTSSKIPNIATGNFELYISAKCLTFEGSSQIG